MPIELFIHFYLKGRAYENYRKGKTFGEIPLWQWLIGFIKQGVFS